jgi:hypothetical protein
MEWWKIGKLEWWEIGQHSTIPKFHRSIIPVLHPVAGGTSMPTKPGNMS